MAAVPTQGGGCRDWLEFVIQIGYIYRLNGLRSVVDLGPCFVPRRRGRVYRKLHV